VKKKKTDHGIVSTRENENCSLGHVRRSGPAGRV